MTRIGLCEIWIHGYVPMVFRPDTASTEKQQVLGRQRPSAGPVSHALARNSAAAGPESRCIWSCFLSRPDTGRSVMAQEGGGGLPQNRPSEPITFVIIVLGIYTYKVFISRSESRLASVIWGLHTICSSTCCKTAFTHSHWIRFFCKITFLRFIKSWIRSRSHWILLIIFIRISQFSSGSGRESRHRDSRPEPDEKYPIRDVDGA